MCWSCRRKEGEWSKSCAETFKAAVFTTIWDPMGPWAVALWLLSKQRAWERKSGSLDNVDLASSVATFSAARRSAACTIDRNGHDSQHISGKLRE